MKKLGLSLALASCLLAGCRAGGVAAVPLAASVERPSNVIFVVAVSGRDAPAAGLTADSFTVSEDGEELDRGSIQLKLLDAALAVDTGALLLVDVAGKDETRGEALARAASDFVRAVRASQPVWVYVFDGNEEIFEVASFGVATAASTEPGGDKPPDTKKDAAATPSAAGAVLPELEALAKAATPEASRNLNGALVRALEQLDARLDASDRPVRVGSLVVLASGPDTVGRMSRADVDAALDGTRHAVYGVGADGGVLRGFARAGTFQVEGSEPEESLLARASERVVAAGRSRYLLSYCSPARRGRHTVTVDVDVPAEAGGGHARFDADFYADHFADGCDASATPSFVVTLGYGGRGPAPMVSARKATEAPAEASDARDKTPRAPKKLPAARGGRAAQPAGAGPKPASTSPAPAPAPASKPPADGFEP